MASNRAWQRHGCYTLGSDQYFNVPIQKSTMGCYDDWNSLDHFDPLRSPVVCSRSLISCANIRTHPRCFDLVQRGNWTHFGATARFQRDGDGAWFVDGVSCRYSRSANLERHAHGTNLAFVHERKHGRFRIRSTATAHNGSRHLTRLGLSFAMCSIHSRRSR